MLYSILSIFIRCTYFRSASSAFVLLFNSLIRLATKFEQRFILIIINCKSNIMRFHIVVKNEAYGNIVSNQVK